MNLTETNPSRASPLCTVDMNGLRMSAPAPCARRTAGVRPGRREPRGKRDNRRHRAAIGNRDATAAGGKLHVARLIADAAAREPPPSLARARALATARGAPRVIGLTGGIGSGKSTVSRHARGARGARDRRRPDRPLGLPARQRGLPARSSTRSVPGSSPPTAPSTARALGAIVFADPEARARLNAIVHPLIGAELGGAHRAPRATTATRAPVVVEAAILIEAGWRALVDQLWVVSVKRDTAIARVVGSRSLSRADVERRIDTQLPDAERRRQADVVIENDGDPDALRAQVEAAWRGVSG